MKLTYRVENHICIVALEGQLTKEEVEDAIAFPSSMLSNKSLKGFVINFHKVPHMDSFGLGIIAALSYGVKNEKKKLMICHLNGNVAGLFTMFRLHTLIEIFPTEQEALLGFEN